MLPLSMASDTLVFSNESYVYARVLMQTTSILLGLLRKQVTTAFWIFLRMQTGPIIVLQPFTEPKAQIPLLICKSRDYLCLLLVFSQLFWGYHEAYRVRSVKNLLPSLLLSQYAQIKNQKDNYLLM